MVPGTAGGFGICMVGDSPVCSSGCDGIHSSVCWCFCFPVARQDKTWWIFLDQGRIDELVGNALGEKVSAVNEMEIAKPGDGKVVDASSQEVLQLSVTNAASGVIGPARLPCR